MIEFYLPWPPSVNRYWRHPSRGPLAGRHLVSADGRAYRAEVAEACRRQRLLGARILDRLTIAIVACPPDRRKRDIDNLLKAVLDALGHAEVYVDDSQIDSLWIARGKHVENGQLRVRVDVIAQPIEEAA